jgi:hypothetical protein
LMQGSRLSYAHRPSFVFRISHILDSFEPCQMLVYTLSVLLKMLFFTFRFFLLVLFDFLCK